MTPSIDKTLHTFWTVIDLDLITEFCKVSIEHMQRVRHATRGRLLLRTPGPVPFGICKCSFVEITDTQLYITSPIHDPFPYMTSYQFDSFPWFETTNSWPLLWFDFLLILTLLNIGFHGASATDVACRQGTLTPPKTWSCPTLGLACVLMSRPISPELVLFPDFWVSNIPRYFSFTFKVQQLPLTCFTTKCNIQMFLIMKFEILCAKIRKLVFAVFPKFSVISLKIPLACSSSCCGPWDHSDVTALTDQQDEPHVESVILGIMWRILLLRNHPGQVSRPSTKSVA